MARVAETARVGGEGEPEVRTSEDVRPRAVRRLKELYAHRQILMNLVRKEIKVKYTSSMLGAAWSMLNPLLFLAVFYFVFGVILQNNAPAFPVYLLSGILAWNFLSTSLSLSARSVVDNANLVKKVYLPREILPLASVGASLFDFVLQLVVLVVFMVVLTYGVLGLNLLLLPLASVGASLFDFVLQLVVLVVFMTVLTYGVLGLNLLLLPLSMVALFLFTCAFALWVGALNVRYRDTQHLLNIGLLMWFWFTPIVYASGYMYARLVHHGTWLWLLYLANPMAAIVFGFQRAFYGDVCPAIVVKTSANHSCQLPPVGLGWLAMLIGCVVVGSALLLYLFWRHFFKLSGDFAEEL